MTINQTDLNQTSDIAENAVHEIETLWNNSYQINSNIYKKIGFSFNYQAVQETRPRPYTYKATLPRLRPIVQPKVGIKVNRTKYFTFLLFVPFLFIDFKSIT